MLNMVSGDKKIIGYGGGGGGGVGGVHAPMAPTMGNPEGDT